MFGLLASTALSIGGIGLSAYAGFENAKLSKDYAAREQAIAGLEQQAESVRYTAMVTDARRRQLENIRNAQRARALAVSAAVNQGVGTGGNNYGSGLPGGLSQISADAATAQKGISNQVQFGQKQFEINSEISAQKWEEAQIKGEMAEYQGLASLGGALTSAAPAFGRLLSFGTGTA